MTTNKFLQGRKIFSFAVPVILLLALLVSCNEDPEDQPWAATIDFKKGVTDEEKAAAQKEYENGIKEFYASYTNCSLEPHWSTTDGVTYQFTFDLNCSERTDSTNTTPPKPCSVRPPASLTEKASVSITGCPPK